MKIFFWQNLPSHHQASALRELALLWEDDVCGVWCGGISEDRLALGWEYPEFGQVKQITLPEDYRPEVEKIISEHRDAIHIFSGVDAYEPIKYAHQLARRMPEHCQIGVMVESGIEMGLRGLIRPLRARWLCRKYIQSTKLVLAMGKKGVDFYRRAGFSDSQIFPFMYQTQAPEVTREISEATDPVRLVYVGKFIARKGVDLMFKGLAQSNFTNWQLDIIGTGDEQQELEALAISLGIKDNISWLGKLPSSEVMQQLMEYDLCIVPSRFEGWGVVVNEALQSHIPVLCSNQVASSELVEFSGAGLVYEAYSAQSFAFQLDVFLQNPDKLIEYKKRAMRYSPHISPLNIAIYLKQVIEHSFVKEKAIRPLSPWANIDDASSKI